MTMDSRGNSHKAAGRPDGGQFDRKTGQASDDDLDFDAADERLSRAMPALDYRARKRLIDAVRGRTPEGGATGGLGTHPDIDEVDDMMGDLRADMAGEGARAVAERRVLPYDTVMQVGEYGDFIAVDDYRRRLPTRLDRARYEAWENSPGGDDDYDAALLDAWNDPDALERLSADSPLWNMDVNDGAYETEMELDWVDDCGYGCDPVTALPGSGVRDLGTGAQSGAADAARALSYGPLKDVLRGRADMRMDACRDGGILLRSKGLKGRGARIALFGPDSLTVSNRAATNGNRGASYRLIDDTYYSAADYGSMEAATRAAVRDAASRLDPDATAAEDAMYDALKGVRGALTSRRVAPDGAIEYTLSGDAESHPAALAAMRPYEGAHGGYTFRIVEAD